MRNIFNKAASFLDRSPELWKESIALVELNRRFLWFLILRCGVISAMLAISFTKKKFFPQLEIASVYFFRIGTILLVLNVLYWCHYKWVIVFRTFPSNARKVAENVQVQIIFDFLILGWLVYECGGIESPLIYFFLFHNTLSCLFFRRRVSFLHTLLSITIILAIFLLSSFGVLPERHLIITNMSNRASMSHLFAYYYLAGVVFVYLTAWYLISTITESLKFEERELQTKIQEMEDLAREKTRYLLVTTHELKAPFAAIQSYVNIALDGYAGDFPEKIREILQKIKARCITLANMITEMIQLANIASIKERGQDIAKARTDLSKAIMEILPRFEASVATKHVVFDTSGLSDGHFVEVNKEQFEILFNNVIGNAVLYSFPNTVIATTVKDNGKSIIASVSDKGIGIKKDQLEKVFLEHFRTEKAAAVNPNSTGLGLTIARQIMDIHDGRIWIESAEDIGTTVFVEFPKATL